MEEVLSLLYSKLEIQKNAKINFWKDLFPGCSEKYTSEKKALIEKRIAQLKKAIEILEEQ